MKKEKWKRIFNHYAVSSWGRFYNLDTQKFIDGYLHKSKMGTYRRIELRGARFFAHEMVAYKFSKLPKNYTWETRKKWVTNHKDLNTLNNNENNVEVITRSRNTKHWHDNKEGPEERDLK